MEIIVNGTIYGTYLRKKQEDQHIYVNKEDHIINLQSRKYVYVV